MTKELGEDLKEGVLDGEGSLGTDDLSDGGSTTIPEATPYIDLVKNQTPHEFGQKTGDQLSSLARGKINTIKELQVDQEIED